MLGKQVFARWLKGELPTLVEKGVIDAEAAGRIASHYEAGPASGGWMLAAFGALGALCLLGGVILVFAHNWQHLGRFTKVALALAPLAVCHGLALFTRLTGRSGPAWKEGVGIAMNLSLAAALGIVSQTYNLGGTFEDFIKIWTLLALPVPYVTGSVGAFILWCATALLSFGNPADSRDLWQFWPLFLAALPFPVFVIRTESHGPRFSIAAISLALTTAIGAILSHKFFADTNLYLLFLLLAGGALHILGVAPEAGSSWKNPFRAIGGLGLVAAVLFLSWDDAWAHLLRDGINYNRWGLPGWYADYGVALVAAAALGWGWLTLGELRRKNLSGCFLAAAPVVYLIAKYLLAPQSTFLASLLFNLYGLALGVATIRSATHERSIGRLNAGMGLIAVLAVMRFVDSDLSMVLRGVAFIAVGLAFFAANWMMIRKGRAS